MIRWLKSWIRHPDGHRRALWPIRLKWGHYSHWFVRHGWILDHERCSYTARGCMPGWRGVYGQTIHFGKLKVCLGKYTGGKR